MVFIFAILFKVLSGFSTWTAPRQWLGVCREVTRQEVMDFCKRIACYIKDGGLALNLVVVSSTPKKSRKLGLVNQIVLSLAAFKRLSMA